MFDLYFRPVSVQLFSDQHGQASPDALAHFRMAEQYRDAVVVADAQKGVGCEHIALILGRRGKTMGTGNDKRHHQPTAQHGRTLEEAATR
ncbi:hypothetical protein D3C86_1048200 [compost metagenome]